jgi:hypothetical protein
VVVRVGFGRLTGGNACTHTPCRHTALQRAAHNPPPGNATMHAGHHSCMMSN